VLSLPHKWAHIELMMEVSYQALQRVDTALASVSLARPQATVAHVSQAVGDLPAGYQYAAYDAEGRLILSSVNEAVGIAVADRPYFHQVRDGEPLVISPQLEERLSGEQVFVVARRLEREGTFAGAATIAIPTRTLSEFWRALELGPQSTVSVVRDDGWLVARFPQLERTIDLSRTPLFAQHLSTGRHGFYHSSTSPADGVSRIVAFRALDRWPLIATAGVARDETLAEFQDNLQSGLLIGMPLYVMLTGGLIWIVALLKSDARKRLALEQALARNQSLFREIHHRVKNNLQAVSSLVQLQPMPAASKESMKRRLAAMIAVHEQMYRSDQYDQVDVVPYARRIVEELSKGYNSNVEVDVQLEPLSLNRDRALPLGLILNELVSNAFKHAFPEGSGGHLTVRLTIQDGHARLSVSDDGPGYATDRSRNGMGQRLVAGFVEQLGGEVRIEIDNGTTVTVTFPSA
jgi:two-component system, sensor histidine kinase PdtaS